MCNKKIGHTKIRQKDNTCFNKPPSIYPSLDSLILNYQIWHVFFSPMSRPNLKLYQPYPFDCTWTFLKWCLKLDGIQSLTLLKVCLKRLGETTKWMHSTSVFLGDQFKIISIYIYIPKDPWECDIYLHMKCGCLLEIKVNTQKSILFDKKSSRKFQGPQDTYQTLREVSTL